MAGIEHGFRSFTAVFSVNSALSLTRPEAADVLAKLAKKRGDADAPPRV